MRLSPSHRELLELSTAGLLTAATHIFLDANSLTGVLPTESGELGAHEDDGAGLGRRRRARLTCRQEGR